MGFFLERMWMDYLGDWERAGRDDILELPIQLPHLVVVLYQFCTISDFIASES